MTRRLAVAHGSAELYGSDLQLVESVRAALGDGWDVVVTLPVDGPLRARLEALGVWVVVRPVPVLRKSLLRAGALPRLAWDVVVSTVRGARWLRRQRVDAVYVNTVTVPSWLAAARLAGRPVLCHVHEAEADLPRPVAAGLTAPLLLAHRIVANSEAARAAAATVFPRLARRTRVVHNGFDGPPSPSPPVAHDGPLRIALVGRLSPRKGTDVALEAVARVAATGRRVELDVAGSCFEGYEWFEQELRDRADRDDLRGVVRMLGFVSPTWPVLARADVVLVPSRVEPFGNTAVEALLARRAVVASDTQGLAEIVHDGRTGLLVPPGDAEALAAAIATLADDPDMRVGLAENGEADARERFSSERYAEQVRSALRELVERRRG